MKKLENFEGRIVEVFFNNDRSETGKLMGIDQGFIYLENRISFYEKLEKHVSLGDAWLSLDEINQISIIREDEDIIEIHKKQEILNKQDEE